MRRETLALPVVFRRRDAVRDGVITERELRGPGYQRVLHGVYTVRGIPLTHEIRCQAAALLLAPGSVVTGGSAATMLGVELNQWSDDVEVLIPEGGRWTTPRGLSTRRARRVLHGETVSGVPLATRDRMAFDLASRGDLAEAVARLDVVVRSGVLHLDRYRRWLDDLHDPHVVLARRAAELCDPRAESRPESIVRVVLHLADLMVEPRFYVYDRSGRFVARLDLALAEFKVAVEYDGQWHALKEQLEKDRARLRMLRDLGWEVVHITGDMLRDRQAIVDAVLRAVARQKSLLVRR